MPLSPHPSHQRLMSKTTGGLAPYLYGASIDTQKIFSVEQSRLLGGASMKTDEYWQGIIVTMQSLSALVGMVVRDVPSLPWRSVLIHA